MVVDFERVRKFFDKENAVEGLEVIHLRLEPSRGKFKQYKWRFREGWILLEGMKVRSKMKKKECQKPRGLI